MLDFRTISPMAFHSISFGKIWGATRSWEVSVSRRIVSEESVLKKNDLEVGGALGIGLF